MKKVLKICCNTWKNESRDKRELTLYQECGATVCVLAKGNENDKGRLDTVDGFDVYRYTTRPLGVKIPNIVNRVLSVFVWAHFVREIKPDVISGHDLSGLLIGWLYNTLFSKNKAALIYDSHEFELGRNTKRNKLMLFIVKKLEGFLISKSVFSVVVNDAIACELKNIYNLQKDPVVVRNVPKKWSVSAEECALVREEIQKHFLERPNFLVLYHGALTTGRGIETLLDLVECNGNIAGVVLGNGESSYIDQLKQRASDNGISERVVFHPAVSQDVLCKYVGAVDLSLITIPAVCKSYYYALPNKLFENIQAMTPVVCSNFPAMEQLVKEYDIGLCCDPENLNEINAAVEKLRTDSALYSRCKENLCKAKQDLCWENEKNVLKEAVLETVF